MVDVQFQEEEQWAPRTFKDEGEPSKFVKLILKTGLVKDQKKANYVLMAVSVFFFLTTIFVSLWASGNF